MSGSTPENSTFTFAFVSYQSENEETLVISEVGMESNSQVLQAETMQSWVGSSLSVVQHPEPVTTRC